MGGLTHLQALGSEGHSGDRVRGRAQGGRPVSPFGEGCSSSKAQKNRSPRHGLKFPPATLGTRPCSPALGHGCWCQPRLWQEAGCISQASSRETELIGCVYIEREKKRIIRDWLVFIEADESKIYNVGQQAGAPGRPNDAILI